MKIIIKFVLPMFLNLSLRKKARQDVFTRRLLNSTYSPNLSLEYFKMWCFGLDNKMLSFIILWLESSSAHNFVTKAIIVHLASIDFWGRMDGLIWSFSQSLKKEVCPDFFSYLTTPFFVSLQNSVVSLCGFLSTVA